VGCSARSSEEKLCSYPESNSSRPAHSHIQRQSNDDDDDDDILLTTP
jgi:hypothetical protein